MVLPTWIPPTPKTRDTWCGANGICLRHRLHDPQPRGLHGNGSTSDVHPSGHKDMMFFNQISNIISNIVLIALSIVVV
jgi:hypothetical protein